MITPGQLHVLQHALGLDDFGRGKAYRNHYTCGPGHHGFDDCRAMVAAGNMVERAPHALFGGDSCFCVTDEGRSAVLRYSPQVPRTTRSQRRYLAYLEADSGVSFGEWLKGRSCDT